MKGVEGVEGVEQPDLDTTGTLAWFKAFDTMVDFTLFNKQVPGQEKDQITLSG